MDAIDHLKAQEKRKMKLFAHLLPAVASTSWKIWEGVGTLRDVSSGNFL